VVTTIDSETFHKKKKNAPVNGFTIDKDGKITGTLNLVSYLKVAPDEALSYPPGSEQRERAKRANKK
jgi:hypothetical protein